MLAVSHLSVKRGSAAYNHILLDDINCSLQPNTHTMLVGPNGAGKTTLINAIAQNTAYTGDITLDGTNLRVFKPAQLAARIGVLAQSHHAAYPFTAREVARLGRYAHMKGLFKTLTPQDERKIEEALDICGLLSFADRSVLTLSGGELRRVFLAQLIAQDPMIMILDEPANDLDLKYQRQIFELVGQWVKQPGRCAISAVHDLNMARVYGSHALLLDNGRMVSFGQTETVLTPNNLNPVYGMDVAEWMRELNALWV